MQDLLLSTVSRDFRPAIRASAFRGLEVQPCGCFKNVAVSCWPYPIMRILTLWVSLGPPFTETPIALKTTNYDMGRAPSKTSKSTTLENAGEASLELF